MTAVQELRWRLVELHAAVAVAERELPSVVAELDTTALASLVNVEVRLHAALKAISLVWAMACRCRGTVSVQCLIHADHGR